ncbi:terpenoid cyclases/Protein prenyltransferase [Ascodesmis nigricans]|uniref:Geranylgeranyl transferase type-1 subunit beta n=1 Tax=Ascodesmis nigricans TaxID=341454 RepID=A0A4S2N154_9PEZI|nr:terpenoid cyclases/Protein prenyltransferase [Ascodesmis nigricans]
MSTAPPSLNHPRHLKYWLRNLRTFLPSDYTPTDLNRLTLGFFIVSALDLLGSLHTSTTPEERNQWIDWIYSNQLPDGGFRGSPATQFVTAPNSRWDPANLPATFFAIVALVTLGDDLSRVNRKEILEWLPILQRDDGSFGEWVLEAHEGDEGQICGGRDMRYIYFAAALRWMLRGKEGSGMEDIADWDTGKAVDFIIASQSYDYGIAEMPYHEAHAGMTYCALGALSLLGVLKETAINRDGLLSWLLSRQVAFKNIHGMTEEDYTEIQNGDNEEEKQALEEVELMDDGSGRPKCAGFNGRCNKMPDTCYSFWVGASLEMLKKFHLLNIQANRRFLLEKTQHIIGGFKKLPQPGGYPDILHSYLGLAALSLAREEGLCRLDAALCVSIQTKERLTSLKWWSG